jgi:RNA polymerase sigma factor (sigma-70 family)
VVSSEPNPGPNPGSPAGSETPFELFARLYPTLRRFAAVVADFDMDPDDLVQDALAATLRRQDLTEISHPEAYLKQAIMHTVTNGRRRAARYRRLLPRLRPEEATADHYPSDLAILDVLSPTDRAVIYLSDVEQLSGAVIAEELGLTPGAVRKRISRARSRLRSELGPELALADPNQQEQQP